MNRRPTADQRRIEDVVEMIGSKRKLLILRHLIYGGTTRFNVLHRAIPGITQTMLTKQLQELERDGLVARRAYAEVPRRIEYAATAEAERRLSRIAHSRYDPDRAEAAAPPEAGGKA